MPLYRILVVDDEETQREMLDGFLKREGYSVSVADSGEEALKLSRDKYFELALIDLKMPGMNGIELLTELKKINPEIQTIVMTAYGTMETAIEALRKGAIHYLNKPIDLEELRITIKKALENQSILAENRYLKEQLEEKYKELKIIGESKAIKEVLSTVTRVAKSDSTALIRGESGTGKELVARSIHALSDRSGQKFISLSCAAIPETLLESELFGYEKGAFTGATRRKIGRFELADSGTLFLDEIGDLSLETQVKLLRVIETQEFERLGGKETIKVNARILSATHQDLEKKIKERAFREDLYYRLNVITIFIPPLRERKEDILSLVDYFIQKYNQKCGKNIKGITQEAKDILLSHSWPGNIRELENVIERGVVLNRGEAIDKTDLAYLSFQKAEGLSSSLNLKDLEKSHILKVLDKTGGNLSQAAELLGIHRNTLRLKIKEYGIKV
ncbi:MAG: sigma-54 dependent transcriptional regulator [candidate division Zixibacteria bacterium]|nr:sigma-54 dependent transcriptional regulator [candidate division Zixibacteria bacterium]